MDDYGEWENGSIGWRGRMEEREDEEMIKR